MKYRVSNVEAFRRWESSEDGDTERLIADIRGLSEPSVAMEAGTAFHKALEEASSACDYDRLLQPGYVFTFAHDFELCLPPIRELRSCRTFTVDGEPIVISGQVDGLDGGLVIDHKTTARFDPERYLDGYQWRLYLSIFRAQRFRWGVFEWDEIESYEPSEGFELPPRCYEVSAMHTLEQFRYPGMEEDCEAVVTRFARFVREHVEETA